MEAEENRGPVSCRWSRHYQVELVEGLLGSERSPIEEILRGRRAMLVTTPTVASLYGSELAATIPAGTPVITLHCTEENKSLRMAERLCRIASEHGIDRKGVLIAFGGGVMSDIVTFAASMIRRGIAHIRIPTTLIGQVDAGIGIKGAVNFHGKKSFLGCFYPPQAVLIDPLLLRSLPKRYLRVGAAEIIKMAIIRDAQLFRLLETYWPELYNSNFQEPQAAAREVILRAVNRMLEELEPNIFEDQTYRRAVDFGHTFSPFVESLSGFLIPHGEAVAMDLAFSAMIAVEMDLLAAEDADRILRLLRLTGLEIHHPLMTERASLRGMEDAMKHRGGNMNLVVPTGIGSFTFIERPERLPHGMLESAVRALRRRAVEFTLESELINEPRITERIAPITCR